jgi:hypothetical protein
MELRRRSSTGIGYVSGRTPEDSVEVLADFRRGLAETGFVEGQNVVIEYPLVGGTSATLLTHKRHAAETCGEAKLLDHLVSALL